MNNKRRSKDLVVPIYYHLNSFKLLIFCKEHSHQAFGHIYLISRPFKQKLLNDFISKLFSVCIIDKTFRFDGILGEV